jgi:hypothetical protein
LKAGHQECLKDTAQRIRDSMQSLKVELDERTRALKVATQQLAERTDLVKNQRETMGNLQVYRIRTIIVVVLLSLYLY